jgi:hypothetical protein
VTRGLNGSGQSAWRGLNDAGSGRCGQERHLVRACVRGGAVAVGRVGHFAVQVSGRFKSEVGLHCSRGPGPVLIQHRAALLKWVGLWPFLKTHIISQ